MSSRLDIQQLTNEQLKWCDERKESQNQVNFPGVIRGRPKILASSSDNSTCSSSSSDKILHLRRRALSIVNNL